jgi:hypothetical protein
MSDTDQLALGASAPGGFIAIPDGLVVELETTLDLTEDQRAKALKAKRMKILHGLTGVARAQAMREVRESLGAKNGSGHNGWDSLCRSDFDTNASDANTEIRGLEAFEAAFASKSGPGSPSPTIPAQVGSSHLNEVGRVSDVKARMQLAALVRDAEIKLSCTALRAKAKQLKSDAGKVKLKASAPPKGPAAPKLPTAGKPASGGKGMSVSKWTAPGTPQGKRMDKELAYLAGTEKGNEAFKAAITAARRGSARSGKFARIQALAEALHTECKAVSDRYQAENEHARAWKRYMTVWQHHWAVTDQFDMPAAMKGVAEEMAEASRHFEITGMLSWSNDVTLEE